MTLQPEVLSRPAPSLTRVIAATALGTAAVFTAGLLTGAVLLQATRVRPAPDPAPAPAHGFAEPPPAVPVAVRVAAVPAIPQLGWTASAAHGPVAPSLQWAATLIDASSQYTAASWSAAQVLGAPDVYPQAGDNVGAWATLSADGGPEWIEVGFDRPARIDAVHVLETYNPGAIRRVEATDADGRTVVLYDRGPQPLRGIRAAEAASTIRVITGACAPFAVHQLRVSLDSRLAAGWNELDAIGVHACP